MKHIHRFFTTGAPTAGQPVTLQGDDGTGDSPAPPGASGMSGGMRTRTLGCKVNFADTEAVIEAVRAPAGGQPVEIIATCCVTAEGEKQSRKEVRRALRRAGSEGRVFVTGCAARLNADSFRRLGANVEVVAGEPAAVAGAINRRLGSDGPAATVMADRPLRTRRFLKIQDGCARRCSYCLIPRVRGEPRSLPAGEVVGLARRRLAEGCAELVINGINLGDWRSGAERLPELLDRLAVLEGLKRLRISSIEPGHVTRELLEVFNRHAVIGRHLHIPMQSGDDRVLRAMGRPCDRAVFLKQVELAREALPEINITTDAIVGFPSEDEEAFAATCRLVEEAGITRVHVFPYSVRPGAPAAALGDPVPPAGKRRRGRLLRELAARQGMAHRQRKVGRTSEVLLESRLASGYLGGYSLDYTRFEVEGGRPGELARVTGQAAGEEAVRGKVEP